MAAGRVNPIRRGDGCLFCEMLSEGGQKRIADVSLRERRRQKGRLFSEHCRQILSLPFGPLPLV